MAIELENLASGFSTGIINDNFRRLEEYINDNLLNRDGLESGEANQMELPLDMNSHPVLNAITDPGNPGSLLTVDFADHRFVNVTGDTMSGSLDMDGNDVTGVGTTRTKSLIVGGIPVKPPTDLDVPFVIYVDTIADLQALDTSELVDGQQVQVKEYHAGTGVGGGEFYWDASSTEDENGGTVFSALGETAGRFKRNIDKRISLHAFGAKGDGTTDDTVSFNAALEYLRDNGGGTLELPSGAIIRITAPLRVFSGTIIRGNGATIIASEEGWVDTSGRGMLELVAASDVVVSDLTLDHNCSGHSNPRPSYCALLLATSDNKFENVVFSDSGSDTGSPSGPQLMMIAKDFANERSESTASVYSDIVGPCSRNTIKDCTFELPKTAKVSFAMRLVTDWSEHRPIDSFINHAEENKFEGCRFYGDYLWNFLEVAGGGSRNNLVSGCFFRGDESLTAIDFDKGANYNIALGNIVEGIGRPDRYLNNTTTRLVAINVHGNSQYLSVGNIVANNIIRGVGNPEDQDGRQGAIGVSYATDTTVNGNHIENVNNGIRGAGISIGHGVDRLLITGNTIREVRSGVADNQNSTSLGLVTVANNQITSLSTCVVIGGGGENSGITLTGNSLVHVGESLQALVVGSRVTHCTLTSNFLSGGSDTVVVAANRNTLIGNTIRGAAARGIRVSAGVDNLLLGNTVEDSGIGDYIASGADTATPTLIGNTFSHGGSFRKAPTITYGTEAPTSGSWSAGDRVQNEAPVLGGVLGWICLSGGTPGTWATYGKIE